MKNFSSITHFSEFDGHKIVSSLYDEKTGLQGFIAIHRGGFQHPAFGATRLWQYSASEDALKDALRLSRMMSYKSALAGLPYGGGKAVIMEPQGSTWHRAALLRAYAQRVNYLQGHFITGTDVGLSASDVKMMSRVSPFMIGTKSDPTIFTALGISHGLQACLKEVFGTKDFHGRSFAIQGVGKIGTALLDLVYSHAERIFISDINANSLAVAKRRFPRAHVVKPQDIHRQKVDVFSPCAMSGTINPKSIHELHCAIVAGGANNQLASEEAGDALWKKGILYAPDYVLNAGGLICVTDEYEHKGHARERVMQKVSRIGRTLTTILAKSKTRHVPPHRIANEMAEKIMHKMI